MTARKQRRAAMVPAIAKLTRSQAWLQADDDRRQLVIAVLPDDTVDYVLRLLAEVHDGAAFLATLTDAGVRIVALTEVTPGGQS